MIRLLVMALGWALPGLFIAWAVVRLTGSEPTLAAPLLAFTPYAALGALALTLLALLRRRWLSVLVIGATTAALGLPVLPRAMADLRPTRPVTNAVLLRIMTVNLGGGRADPAGLVALVTRHQADVLTVAEVMPDSRATLGRAGLEKVLPFVAEATKAGTTGTAIYSRYPIRNAGVHGNTGPWLAQAYGLVTVPHTAGVRVESVHPAPPRPGNFAGWRRDLASQPAAATDGPPQILAGDFNATLDHQALRRILGLGWSDAADVVGQGLHGTWGPYAGKPIPPVAIDHVLVSRRVAVRDVQMFRLRGTDHRTVLATLLIPPA